MVDMDALRKRVEHGQQVRVEKVALETVPGGGNADIREGSQKCGEVVDGFVRDTNNWFEVLYVKAIGQDKFGIPARYRWTILRWIDSEMSVWLDDNGWMEMAHTLADSNARREDEMEMRFVKEFDVGTVYANFLVHVPNSVFEALNTGKTLEVVREEKEVRERRREIAAKVAERKRAE